MLKVAAIFLLYIGVAYGYYVDLWLNVQVVFYLFFVTAAIT